MATAQDRTERMTKDLIEAAKRVDWQTVVLNGGPPCFAYNVDGDGTFCLRAERWMGHGKDHHTFISLAELLVLVQLAELADSL